MISSDVQLSQLPGTPVAVVRRHVRASELGRMVPEGCGIVWNFLRAHQLKGGRNVAIYWDGSIRLEVGVELDQPLPEGGDVVRSATPAGPAASLAHFGPYHTLGNTHAAIRDWCAANGHHLAGPNWEVYGHWQADWDANPSRIRTDVFYLLAQP
jgi:effector-binding domain-containing protein